MKNSITIMINSLLRVLFAAVMLTSPLIYLTALPA
jgi:hypothetical protein